MKEYGIRAALALALSAAAAYLRGLAVPLAVLGAAMLTDYVTGVLAAWTAARLSSRVGVAGVFKKLGCLVAVGVAVVADYVIRAAAREAGLGVDAPFSFGLLVTVWFVCNELLSILENLAEMGVPLPGFLVAAVKKLRRSAEEKGETK